MRILVLSTWFPYPPTNGSELRAYYLLRGLSERHEVTALAFRWDDRGEQGSLPPLAGVALRPVRANPFHLVGLPTLIKFAAPIPLALWPVAAMRAALHAADVAGVAWDAVVGLCEPVLRYLSAPTATARVFDIDTSLSYQALERYQGSRGTLGRWRTWASWHKARWAEAHLLRPVDLCTAVAAHELPYLRDVAPRWCHVQLAPNGVDCERNRPGLAAHSPAGLVYNGALTYAANYDAMRYFLGDIYPLVRRDAPAATVSITGRTAGVDLAGLALDETVRLTGYVDDIRPIVAGSAVWGVPLRQGGGTRLKILEAMALGTPVVSTTKGAEGLDVIPGEHLLIADDPRAFAQATVRLLTDAALRAQLAAAAREWVDRRHDWNVIAAEFAHLVEDTVIRKQRALSHG